MNEAQSYYSLCLSCQGRGKKSKRIRKKAKLKYQRQLQAFEQNSSMSEMPVPPKGHLDTCPSCEGSGLQLSKEPVISNELLYPHVAIVGGGIGGVALAIACLHRGIPFTLYERDNSFEARSQGYGLTLQQASKAIEGLGIKTLNDGLVSTRHVVHSTDGKIIGEWGIRKWKGSGTHNADKRTNVHIARQSLRSSLLAQLNNVNAVVWGHQLVDFIDSGENGVDLTFNVNNQLIKKTADLLVGADGIRSTVRELLLDETSTPLNYLGCIVILGICPLSTLNTVNSELLDSSTVFQTANGNERLYVMPYKLDSVMWQLSFPLLESEAIALSNAGPLVLKQEAIARCQWHTPIPEILLATEVELISGYPVYDRQLVDTELLLNAGNVTLIGDAAHPMSPFKGQGANQALLDALSLARTITKECRPLSGWKEQGIRGAVLNKFEEEMWARSAVKVKDSADAANFLHSDVVLHEGNEPRGRCLLRDE